MGSQRVISTLLRLRHLQDAFSQQQTHGELLYAVGIAFKVHACGSGAHTLRFPAFSAGGSVARVLQQRLQASAGAAWTQQQQQQQQAQGFSTSSGGSSKAAPDSSKQQYLQQHQAQYPNLRVAHVAVGPHKLVFESGRLANLAHGSCIARYGGTVVLSTVVVDGTPLPDADGTQLQVCECVCFGTG